MDKNLLFNDIVTLLSELRSLSDEKVIQKKIAEISAKSAVLMGLNLDELKRSNEITNKIVGDLKDSTVNSIKSNEIEAKKAKRFSLVTFVASVVISLFTIFISWKWWTKDNSESDNWHKEQVTSLHHLEQNSDSVLNIIKRPSNSGILIRK